MDASSLLFVVSCAGHYSFQPTLHVVAHTTQFSSPGCHYLDVSATGDSGYLDVTHQSSIVALLCNNGPTPYFSLVIETIHETAVKQVSFSLQNIPASVVIPTGGLHVWHTNFTDQFRHLGQTPVTAGRVTLVLFPDSIYTLTTTTGQSAPAPHGPNPPSRPFPLPYHDTFQHYTAEDTVHYFTDEGGSFNAAADPTDPSGSNQVLQQVINFRTCFLICLL